MPPPKSRSTPPSSNCMLTCSSCSHSILVQPARPTRGLAAQHAVPAIYFSRSFVVGGGLISYGPDTPLVAAQTKDRCGAFGISWWRPVACPSVGERVGAELEVE